MRQQTTHQRSSFRHIKSALLLLLAIPLVLLGAAILRTFLLAEPASSMSHVFRGHVIDMVDESRSMVRGERLAGALRIETVSYAPGEQNFDAFPVMHRYLETNFPLIHGSSFIKREVINKYSLLYTIQGTADKSGMLPYLLCSHLDVVPADPATWDEPPFGGNIVNKTYIYGRGSMDDKAGVMGIMEALEYLLQKGDRPKRAFYIAFGHDEEVHGAQGAKQIARLFQTRGIEQFDFLIDEGFPVTRGFIPGTDKLISMVGVSEKGHATLSLTVTGAAGHSSFPPAESAIGMLAAAIAKLEQNPQPSMFGTGPEAQTFADVAPHCSFLFRLLYGNLWLFSGLMSQVLQRKAVTNAMVRTTTAITMFNGGIKENVVPPTATAVVNFRIHPSQTVADVVYHVRQTVADARVEIQDQGDLSGREAHPISPSGPGDVAYQLLKASMSQVYPNAVVVPGTFIANTDTRWYLSFTRNIYRVYSFVITPQEANTIHGDNERITVANYHNSINFYYRLIKNADLLVDKVPKLPEHYGAEL